MRTDAPSGEPSSDGVSRLSGTSKAGGIMVASLLLSRILGLLRDTVIASQFGLRLENDAYRIAIQVPDLIFMLIAGGGLSSAFIPIFAELIHTDREREAWKVFSVVVSACSVIALVAITAMWVAAPWLVGFLGKGQDPTALPLAVHLSRIMLPAQFAFLIGSILIATLYARKIFLIPGLAPNVYNLGIIVGAAALPGIFGFGIEGVAWGALAGAIIGNLLLPILAMRTVGSHFAPSLQVRDPHVRKFFLLLLPVILGFSLPSMVNIVTQKFASGYGEGANTALAYANNLMQAPLGIFGQSLALAVFPALSQFVAQSRMDLYRDQISRTLRTVLFLGIPSSVVLFVLAPDIVDAIYGYGKAQDPVQLDNIAQCLRIYCLGIFAWCVQPVLMRGFFSLHKTLLPVTIGTVMTAAFVAMCAGVRGSDLGFRAIPWATNAAAILLAIALYVALERSVGKLDRRGIAVTLMKSVVATVPMVPFLWVGERYLNHLGKVPTILGLLFVLCAAGWAYAWAGRLMKMPETDYVDRAMAKINRRRRPISVDETGGP